MDCELNFFLLRSRDLVAFDEVTPVKIDGAEIGGEDGVNVHVDEKLKNLSMTK